MNGLVRGQRSTRVFLPNNKPFLAVQPSHENTQHISAYRPSLERGSLMDGCCLLPGAAYEQGCSITHLFFISHDINVSKGRSPREFAGVMATPGWPCLNTNWACRKGTPPGAVRLGSPKSADEFALYRNLSLEISRSPGCGVQRKIGWVEVLIHSLW